MLHDVTTWLTGNLVELLMLSVGLRVRAPDVLAEVRRPSLVVRELLVLWVGVPVITLLVVYLVPVPPPADVVFTLFAICPAAPYVLHGFQGRRTAASKAIAIVAVALAASVIVVPMWVWILNRLYDFSIRASPVDVAALLIIKALIPLLAGVGIKKLAPRPAQILGRVLNVLVIAALVIDELLLLRVGSDTLRLLTVELALAALLVSVGSALVGELAGGRDPDLREILGMAAVTGNPSVALAVLVSHDPKLDVGGVIAIYLLCRLVAALPYRILTKLRSRNAERA